jgi:hypothetical protein
VSEDFLSRWSRLKRTGGEAPAKPQPAVSQEGPQRPVAAAQPAASPAPPPPLPPIDSLEPGADISQFMQAQVDEGLKRQALKKLLQDPRFNVMDGLDVYIADFSEPDPLPEGWLEKMNQTVRFGDYREPEPAEEPVAEEEAAVSGPSPETANEDAEELAPVDTEGNARSLSPGTQSAPRDQESA